MINNQLTREKVQWLHDAAEEAAAVGIKLTMNPSELLMFTSELLATMDSEPVAWKWRLVDSATGDHGEWRVTLAPSLPGQGAGYRTETIPLYRHAQPAPVVDSESVQMFDLGSIFKPQIVSEQEADCHDCAHYNPKICHGEGCPAISEKPAQLALVVPEGITVSGAMDFGEQCYADGWNKCRAAMLKGDK